MKLKDPVPIRRRLRDGFWVVRDRCDQAIAGRGSGANHAGAGFGHGAGGGKMAGRLIMAVVWTCRTSFAGEDGGGLGVLTENLIVARASCPWRVHAETDGDRNLISAAQDTGRMPVPRYAFWSRAIRRHAVSGMKVGRVMPTGGV